MRIGIEAIAKEFDCHKKHAYLITKEEGFPPPYSRERKSGKLSWLLGEVRAYKRIRPDGRGKWKR